MISLSGITKAIPAAYHLARPAQRTLHHLFSTTSICPVSKEKCSYCCVGGPNYKTMWTAVKTGNIANANSILNSGCPTTLEKSLRFNWYKEAIKNDDTAMIDLFISKLMTPEHLDSLMDECKSRECAEFIASFMPQTEACKELFANAVKRGDVKHAKELLQSGKISTEDFHKISVRIQYPLSIFVTFDPMVIAILKNQLEMVKLLTDYGKSPNELMVTDIFFDFTVEESAYSFAARLGLDEIVEYLSTKGAGPNTKHIITRETGKPRDSWVRTIIHDQPTAFDINEII